MLAIPRSVGIDCCGSRVKASGLRPADSQRPTGVVLSTAAAAVSIELRRLRRSWACVGAAWLGQPPAAGAYASRCLR